MAVNKRGRKRQRGQAIAEFAMITPVLMLIIFGIIDISRIYNAWVTVQGSAREAARYGVTGRSDCNITTPTRIDCIEDAAFRRADALTNTPADIGISVRSWEFPDYDNPPTEDDAGEQCDALEVQIDYDFTPSTPLIGNIIGDIHLVGRERMVNEPFGPCEPPPPD
ncbi:MAG: TadE/TadG family type IV pilus assembly protein [Dehalococcoidia bacterium]